MSLRFNTFREKRYLRSKFVEGAYLLASEASDIELELLDLLRKVTMETIGDVALEDAWKVERLSATQLLIKPGPAWFKGLPFQFRSGKDQLVSGAVLSTGVTPVGITASDDATGLGKILLFNDGALTPTSLYKIVISAKEELITEVEDPFLQNANLTESTAQKVRLKFQINLVPDSLQTESPIPYRDESSTSLVATNFPIAGAFASPNLVNQIVVTPTAAGNGEILNLQLITGSEKIDGRDVELTLRNNSSIGGGHPIAKSPTEQAAFENGKLIDSNGNIYHINAIFNGVVSTEVVIRLDKEPNQPNPEILNTRPYTLIKRDVYATDGINGQPQGKLFWATAKVNWNSTDGIVHSSSITDLRKSISKQEARQLLDDDKFSLNTVGGGTLNLGIDASTLSWDAAVKLIAPSTPIQTIASGSGYLIADGFIVYEMDLNSVSSIAKGNLAVTTTTTGTSISMSGSPDLSLVSKGNIIVIGVNSAQITAIDNVNKVLTVSPSLPSSGSATIYRDSYAPGTYVTGKNTYVFASKTGNVVWVADKLALAAGQSAKLGVPSAAGITKVDAYDPVSTTLPSGVSATIDGYTVVNGDKVLFSNLGVVSAQYTQSLIPSNLLSMSPTSYSGLAYTIGSAFNLSSAVFQMQNISGAALGTMVCAVYTDSAGLPGTIIGTSSIVNMNTVSTGSPGAVPFTFSSPVPLSASTKYYFIVQATSTGGSPNFLQMHGKTGSGGGASHEYSSDLGATWTNSNSIPGVVLNGSISAGSNRVYQVSGVGVSLVWSAIGVFAGQLDPTTGDLVIFTKGTQFKNQIAEFDSAAFKINSPVRYFNGVDFWEQSALQISTLNNNSTGQVFSVTALASENMVIDFSINRGGTKEVGTMWLTSDGSVNAYLATGGSAGAVTGVSFSAAISVGNLVLSYTTTNTGSSATMKYSVRRWSDASGGVVGLPSYSPNTATIYGAAFVMSDNSGTPINCVPTFNVLGKTQVTLNFNYFLNRNSGGPVGDLEVYVNGQRFPRFISGATLDGYYKEISTTTIEFSADLTITPVSIEIIKRV